MKSNAEITENRFLGSISTSSFRNLLHRSISTKHKPKSNPKKSKFNAENTPPIDPNVQIDNTTQLSPSVNKKSPSILLTSETQISGLDSHSGAPSPKDSTVKNEISGSDGQHEESTYSDPHVKVMVRIRPVNDHEREGNRTVRKVSPDSLCVGDRKFTFDSVFDSNSNQEDIFQLVGVPLVKNALAGYNTSILSYGQTGSGKTYTMWGPPSAMVQDPSPSSHQGIVPRIFQKLFSEIQRDQENSEGRQINYQCRCSFVEIYNEQIGDLLDPTKRNLEIKDDPKNGLYVENLTEEYVTSYEDVTQIIIKGLSSRKVGATSINSKSSRSHIVFTFVIESWCKGTSSKCFSSSKMSRISLVDLAGLDKIKLDDTDRHCVKEGKNVKKSLSQLGHLVSALAKGTCPGKSEDILYRGSGLTHLLRESLGGNAKLTVICAISPDNKNNGEILSTLRFGQLFKSMRNEPVINEISEDDVNDLSDQIRQLKEELIRARSDVCNSVQGKSGYFKGQNIRENLNQLRVSLNRSLILPPIENDFEEEVNIDEHDIRELRQQLDEFHNSCEENSRGLSGNRDSIQFSSEEESCETDLMSEDDINCPEETEIDLIKPCYEIPHKDDTASAGDLLSAPHSSFKAIDPSFRSCISTSSCRQSTILQDPTLSDSPRIGSAHRKSMAMPLTMLASQNNLSECSKPDVSQQSDHTRSSLRSSRIFPGPTESLAASLQKGLQIIDYHQRNSASNRSSVSFSFEHLTLKPCPEADKDNASVKKLPEERPSPAATLICASCRQKLDSSSNEVHDRDLRNDLEETIMREKELENVCMQQAAKIEQLNCLVEQYKHERDHSVSEHDQESDSLLCLEASKNELLPHGEPRNEEYHTLNDGNKLLECNYVENYQPEFIKEKCEIKEVQEVLNRQYGSCENTSFDMNEKEALLKEIQSLRSKLQSYTDASPNKSAEKLRSSLLLRSIQLRKSVDSHYNSGEELERERQRWTEMESDWISLTDELRIDLASNRQHTEKVEMELRLEKKCTEELDDALHRAVLGHARIVEHYVELQEKYNELVGRHRAILEGVAEVKKAAAKAGAKGQGSRFYKSLAAELSALRVEREREREFLKKENKSLKIQLRDTAEAVHAAGELLVRLREAEQAASAAEENFNDVQQDNEKLKKQMEKLKRKHKMEMITMKQYLAESRLPESALQPMYHHQEDSDLAHNNMIPDDDQAWRAEFGAIYQHHY